jgi:hypothetical protein
LHTALVALPHKTGEFYRRRVEFSAARRELRARIELFLKRLRHQKCVFRYPHIVRSEAVSQCLSTLLPAKRASGGYDQALTGSEAGLEKGIIMRRIARAVPLARVRADHLANHVRHAPQIRWPTHLRMAREVIKLPEALALDVLARSVVAACKCAQAINRKSAHLARTPIQANTAAAFGRVAKCINRAPASIRRHIDDGVASLRWQEPIDTEVITDILEAAVAAFSIHPDCEPAQTALAALTTVDDLGERRRLHDDYSALSWQARANVEAALSTLRSKGTPTAAIVFTTMASAVRAAGSDGVDRLIHALIVDYVAEVAEIWRSAGLRPGRAFYPESLDKERSASYRSAFHRFIDLVLTALVEPWASRHDGDLDADSQQRGSSTDLGGRDTGWLVNDHDLKEALRHVA